MIAIEDLNAVLQLAWKKAGPQEIPTQFPGIPLDATRLASWFEFWVTQSQESSQRPSGGERLAVLLDVHCFSRRPEKRHIFSMIDLVRRTFSHQSFPITPSENEDLTDGILRIREATVRDLSRESAMETRTPLQHLVVSFTAVAEEG